MDEMRTLVCLWDGKQPVSLSNLASQHFLDKSSRKRELDILKYAFIPRFIKSTPPFAWKIVRALEDKNLPVEILRPVYYWITVRNEPILYDFVCEKLLIISRSGTQFLIKDEVVRWIQNKLSEQKVVWSSSVIQEIAGRILSVLRDFGILQGKVKKRIAPFYLPIETFSYIAFCLKKEGTSASKLIQHPDWKLFLLTPEIIERMFLEADRQKMLRFLAAGKVVRIDFPAQTYEEMANVISRRTT